MSWDATAWAKQVTAGGPGPKAVLLCLADRADEEWSCFPSQELLAKETEQSVRTVQRQLLGLERDGLIKRVHRAREGDGKGRGRTSDRYYLLGVNLSGRSEVQGDRLSGRSDGSSGPTRQATSDLHDTGVVGTIREHPEEQEQEHVLVEPPTTDPVLAAFEEFWAAYPKTRRVARRACLAKFRTAVKNGTKPEVIVQAIKDRVAWWDQEGTQDQYRTTSLPWLNQSRWEDEVVGLRAKVRPVEKAYAFTEGVHREPNWELA